MSEMSYEKEGRRPGEYLSNYYCSTKKLDRGFWMETENHRDNSEWSLDFVSQDNQQLLCNRAIYSLFQQIDALRKRLNILEELTGFDTRYYRYETKTTSKTKLIKMTQKEKEEREENE
jgi:hypothetical protein